MKKIILIVLSATFLLASNTLLTTKEQTPTQSITEKLAKKQELRTSKIEAEIAKKLRAREAKALLREEKINKNTAELQTKALLRAKV